MKFNKKVETTPTKVVALNGNSAYSFKDVESLTIMSLTNMFKDQFYKTKDVNFSTLNLLLKKVSLEYVAKLSVYCRTKMNMRSISHYLSAYVVTYSKNKTWTRSFLKKVVVRVDDMLEIYSAYKEISGKNMIPNSMRRAFKSKFNEFSSYQLAKYKSTTSETKLVDLMNIVRPNPELSPKDYEVKVSDVKKVFFNKEMESKWSDLIKDKSDDEIVLINPIDALSKGLLKSFDTWESEVSKVGSDKKEVWKDLLVNKKLGYMALIRNIRNILTYCPELIDELTTQLTDRNSIIKSKILPFRFLMALKVINSLQVDSTIERILQVAISNAIDYSLANVPVYSGSSLVVLDVSGSMTTMSVGNNPQFQLTCSEIGSLFSALLLKKNIGADFMTFDNVARYVKVDITNSVKNISNDIEYTGGGTYFNTIFKTANKSYDRIFIFSDMQGYDSDLELSIRQYKNKFNSNPKIYSFDLAGYGTKMINDTLTVGGYSDEIFKILEVIENDRNGLIKLIDSIELE